MFRSLFLLFTAAALYGQIAIEIIAGATPPLSGAPAADVGIYGIGSTFDANGNAYIAGGNRIWRLRLNGTVDLVAGNGVRGYGGDGGPASEAMLGSVYSMRVTAAGDLYFIDFENARIRRVDAHGRITTVAGNGIQRVPGMEWEGRADQIAISPNYTTLAVDGAGNVYFVEGDGFGSIVFRADAAGNVTRFAGRSDSPCIQCADGDGGPAVRAFMPNIRFLGVDGMGQVYISNNVLSAAFIRKVGLNGIVSTLNASMVGMIGLAVDAAGNVYTASNGPTSEIRKTTPDGIRTTIANLPNATLTTDGQVHAAYVTGNTLYSMDTGRVIRSYESTASPPPPDGILARAAQLGGITAIAANRAGEPYFFENDTCRLRKIDSAGKLRTVAGTGKCGGALPDLPQSDIAVGLDDTIYLCGNGHIFRIGASGVIEPIDTPVNDVSAVVVDGTGRLLLINPNRIVRVELDGRVTSIVNNAGLPGASWVNPQGYGVDPLGNAYFSADRSVFRIEEDGRYAKVLDGEVRRQFSVDRAGRVWTGWTVLDAAGSRTVGLGSDGVALSALASNGDLYVYDARRIYKVTGLGQRPAPAFSATGVVNAASYAGGAVVPGELITIFGSNFGVTGLQVSQPVNNRVPTRLGPLQVTFNGTPGAIAAATPTQINVFVPSAVAAPKIAKIVVQVDDMVSQPITLTAIDSWFGLSSMDASGTGQGAILNANGSVNSQSNPAPPGSIISLFGTGEGAVTPQARDGSLNITQPYPVSKTALAVRIGRQPAEVVFAGGAPTLPIGVYQMNVRIPASTPPGYATVEVLATGGATSNSVLVAVQ